MMRASYHIRNRGRRKPLLIRNWKCIHSWSHPCVILGELCAENKTTKTVKGLVVARCEKRKGAKGKTQKTVK